VGADWPADRPDQPTRFLKDTRCVTTPRPPLAFQDLQRLIREMYFEKDAARGVDGTFMWLMEEVGELAAALREGTPDEQAAEFADVLAWLTTIANVAGIDLAEAIEKKYGKGCPGCGQLVCTCDDAGKP
jgi:NTP pyrophosphatase (non-canonical NTP hydrolase)